MKNGQQIRMKLVDLCLSVKWLRSRIEKKGVSIRYSNLSNILSGVNKSSQADMILKLCDQILNDYEKNMDTPHYSADNGRQA